MMMLDLQTPCMNGGGALNWKENKKSNVFPMRQNAISDEQQLAFALKLLLKAVFGSGTFCQFALHFTMTWFTLTLTSGVIALFIALALISNLPFKRKLHLMNDRKRGEIFYTNAKKRYYTNAKDIIRSGFKEVSIISNHRHCPC